MRPDLSVYYLVSVPDSDPREASPLQGFAPSLCQRSGILNLLSTLPSDVIEFSYSDLDARLARRISGTAPVKWMPLSPLAVCQIPFGEQTPFGVLFVLPEDDASQYLDWASGCSSPPLIVANENGDVSHVDFSLEVLQRHCLEACSKVGEKWGPSTKSEIETLLTSQIISHQRDFGYEVGGHNAFSPNIMALRAAGFEGFSEEPFIPDREGDSPYVAGIVQTANAILDERERIGPRDMHRILPPTPDLMLLTPAIYTHMRKRSLWKGFGDRKNEQAYANAVQALIQQKGYRFEGSLEKLAKSGFKISKDGIEINPIIQIRQRELALCTSAIGVLAASEISAVIRMPNRVNQTSGQVRQFAAQRRGTDAQDRKRAKAFKEMQKSLKKAVPDEFIEVIKRSTSGIRIVGDAPLEWLDVDGLPLSLRFNTSRLPSTPGNLLIGQLIPMPTIQLKPDAFKEVLIINSINERDPVRPFFEAALTVFGEFFGETVKIRHVEVASRKEFVDAVNSFEGAFLIFDGHGSHKENEPGYLWFKDEKVDIWTLKSEIFRPPPIVLLSACDTHAADRNHATTGAGFLSLGVRTVIGSFFPLRADEAAILAPIIHDSHWV